jgi:IS30 family transposase
MREIGRRLGRAASTISRELRRNTAVHDRGGYDADLAHARAAQRARRRRPGRLLTDPELRAVVAGKLESGWSPEQISEWLRREYPDRPDWHLSHETIYRGLFNAEKSGLTRTLTKKLRSGRSMRKRRRRTDTREVRYVIPSKPIDQRPAIVETRERIGDWEGDIIVGRSTRSSIGTLVDRRSRLVRLVHLPHGHAAEAFAAAAVELCGTIPASARFTLTWDQGGEMARHDLIADLFADGIFFAPPASPWLRGTNENTNGLLRQYFPKGTDLSIHGVDELQRVEQLLNTRPRKVLGWRTPAEFFESELAL